MKLKKLEIKEKEKQLKILEEKSKRISLKREAIMKYERYLEKVQQTYPDEFDDISSILNRYKLLVKANEDLETKNKGLEESSEKLKLNIEKFEKDKRQEILTINNDISKYNAQHEEIKV